MNTVRDLIPPVVRFVPARVTSIRTSPDRQTVVLSTGDIISARLIVMATGLNHSLRQGLGIITEELSACHSISIGFDVTPLGRPAFDFPALTYFPAYSP